MGKNAEPPEVRRTVAAPLEDDSHLMTAVVRDSYGAAEVMHLSRIERPIAKDKEVLVRVNATGHDWDVWHMMSGRPYVIRLFTGLRRPRNPVAGLDLAGTVAAVGAGVTRFQIGDEVFGYGRGSFAEYATAKEDKLAQKPAGFSFAEAAVLPVSAVTALQGLRDAGRIKSGQKVLITGASGGVGSYAIQLAKAFGADVTGVCSTSKMSLVRSLGADHIIDYSGQDIAQGNSRYDVILDFAGNPAISLLRRALTPHGTAVIGGGEHGGNVTGMRRALCAQVLSPFISQRLTMFASRGRATDLERISELINAGALSPCVDKTLPLEQTAEAMRYLEAGKIRGKVAIAVRTTR